MISLVTVHSGDSYTHCFSFPHHSISLPDNFLYSGSLSSSDILLNVSILGAETLGAIVGLGGKTVALGVHMPIAPFSTVIGGVLGSGAGAFTGHGITPALLLLPITLVAILLLVMFAFGLKGSELGISLLLLMMIFFSQFSTSLFSLSNSSFHHDSIRFSILLF